MSKIITALSIGAMAIVLGLTSPGKAELVDNTLTMQNKGGIETLKTSPTRADSINEYKKLCLFGLVAFDNKEYGISYEIYEDAVRIAEILNPPDTLKAIAYYGRGFIMGKLAETQESIEYKTVYEEKAIQDLSKALSLDPDKTDIEKEIGVFQNNLAWHLAEANTDLEKALKHAEAALETNAKGTRYGTLGFVQLQKQDYENAVTNLEKALELIPKNNHVNRAVSHKHLAQAYKKLGRQIDAYVEFARSYKGQEYDWNGRLDPPRNPDIDCLGLLFLPYCDTFGGDWQDFSTNGADIIDNKELGEPVEGLNGVLTGDVDMEQFRKGDIIFLLTECDSTYNTNGDRPVATIYEQHYKVWHTGIYTGDGQFIEAEPFNEVIEHSFQDILNSNKAIFVTRLYK